MLLATPPGPTGGMGLPRGIGSGHFDAFGNDDKAEALAAKFTGTHRVANGFEFEGQFGDQDDVRASTNAGMKRNPAGVATHDLNEHDAMMTFRGGVKAVDGLSGDDQCGVEAKSDFGGVEMVVDGFGNADDVDALVEEIARNVLRAVATGDNHGVDTETPGILHAQGGVIVNNFLAVLHGLVGERITAIGGTENWAATRQNAADGFFREFLRALGPDESIKAVADADDAHAVFVDGRPNNGANNGVESGSITAAVDEADCAHSFHICTVTRSYREV